MNRGRPLISVKSEGAATAGKSLEVRKFTRPVPPPQLQSADTLETHADDSSDDESAAEEVIVRIDSPSRLSFRHAS